VAVQAQLEQLEADVAALRAAAEQAAADRGRFVERNRSRLTRVAADRRKRAEKRYLALVDELAAAREDLAGLRGAELWATLFPAAASAQEPPTAQMATGLAQPVKQALGIAHQVQASRLFELLRADARLLAAAATSDQRELLGGAPPAGEWLDPEAEAQAAYRENLQRLRAAGGTGWR
jgi:hypothetical protein